MMVRRRKRALDQGISFTEKYLNQVSASDTVY
jgi:hypothetical protein